MHAHPHEPHRSGRVGWLRAAVLGANDGVVSTASLIVGFASAGAERHSILLAGVAGLVGGALSMAAGEYVSVSSQADSERANLAKESGELRDQPEFEREELAGIYVARGLTPELADQVESLLKRRLLSGLGLARRAGDLTSGFEKVSAAINSGRAAWLIEASDGAADGRRKLLALARKQNRPPGLFGVFSATELGLALGLENVIHTAFLAGRAADRWALDVHRLSGFCPLLPEDWREEPERQAGA